MADSVATHVLDSNKSFHIVQLTGTFDTSDESAVTKVDRSSLTALNGRAPGALDVECIEWVIEGLTRVTLAWEHSAGDATIAVLSGSGEINYQSAGGLRDTSGKNTGTEGDVHLTTLGAASGGSYTILLKSRLRTDEA